MIFLGVTGSFLGAVYYDKWQVKKNRQKWCDLVAHKSEEVLDPHSLPRRLTIYLAAPPGDGLRAAREHFHEYVKPVLVAAAMDWDVVEGRKEGDVRFKTAEKTRKRRRAGGEGDALSEEDRAAEVTKQRFGTDDAAGVAGDLVIGRHTWKEYIRGLHEGWLGPANAPYDPEQDKVPAVESPEDKQAKLDSAKAAVKNYMGKSGDNNNTTEHIPGQGSVGDAAANAATGIASSTVTTLEELTKDEPELKDDPPATEPEKEQTEEEKKAAEKPKPRHPPAYITPEEYSSASPSSLTPDTIGPSTAVSFPHLLGFRNTPIRIYRFLNRRVLADNVGRQVASAILASHRPYSTVSSMDDASASTSGSVSEVATVAQHEERDWWKTTYRERESHEESVWIEPCIVDDRLTARMSQFELSAEEEARAKRIGAGKEKAITKYSPKQE
jgi:import inner membrane translocase subunit TIM54